LVRGQGESRSIIVGHPNTTLDLIRSLVSNGMFKLGGLNDNCRFTAWSAPLDESMQRIRDVYVTNFDDHNTWPWFCWLDLTEKGQQVAERSKQMRRTRAVCKPIAGHPPKSRL
jgi:hypothetical protein